MFSLIHFVLFFSMQKQYAACNDKCFKYCHMTSSCSSCLIQWVKSDCHLNMLFCILTLQIFWQYDLQTWIFTRFVYHNGNRRSHWVHCIVGHSMSTVICFMFICMHKLWIHILCTVYSKYSILMWYFIAETSSGNNYSTFPKKN